MSGLRGLPYIVVMERADAMEEHVVAIPDGEEPSETAVEIQSAPISGSATGLASDSGTGSDTDNELGPQGINEQQTEPSQLTASSSGDVRQALPKKRLAKMLTGGTSSQDIRKLFKTADGDPASKAQGSTTPRVQERSGRGQQRARSGQQ